MIKNVASTIKRHTTCDRKHGSHHPIKWFWPVETSPPWVTLGTWSFCLILNKPEFGCFFAGRHTMESSFQDPLQWFFGSSSDEWISVPHFEFFYHNIFWLYRIHTTRRPQNGLLHTEEKELLTYEEVTSLCTNLSYWGSGPGTGVPLLCARCSVLRRRPVRFPTGKAIRPLELAIFHSYGPKYQL